VRETKEAALRATGQWSRGGDEAATGPSLHEQVDYDVAFSFAGEDRDYVEIVAAALEGRLRVFYDKWERVGLWDKDLYAHLDDIYRKRSNFCVIFVSEHYARKAWTNHERKSAQARAFSENREYILPARFDDTEVSGVLPTIGYIDLRNLKPEDFAELLFSKVKEAPPVKRLSRRPRRRPHPRYLYAAVLGLAALLAALAAYRYMRTRPNGHPASEMQRATSGDKAAPAVTNRQEKFLRAIYDIQTKFRVSKLIVDRTGEVALYGEKPRSRNINIAAGIVDEGATQNDRTAALVELIESIPLEYLRIYTETRVDSPFVVSVTEAGIAYLVGPLSH